MIFHCLWASQQLENNFFSASSCHTPVSVSFRKKIAPLTETQHPKEKDATVMAVILEWQVMFWKCNAKMTTVIRVMRVEAKPAITEDVSLHVWHTSTFPIRAQWGWPPCVHMLPHPALYPMLHFTLALQLPVDLSAAKGWNYLHRCHPWPLVNGS